jgi:hypothetical protein
MASDMRKLSVKITLASVAVAGVLLTGCAAHQSSNGQPLTGWPNAPPGTVVVVTSPP